MLNRSASLGMSTNVLKALPGKLDNKRHSSSILYLYDSVTIFMLCWFVYWVRLTCFVDYIDVKHSESHFVIDGIDDYKNMIL